MQSPLEPLRYARHEPARSKPVSTHVWSILPCTMLACFLICFSKLGTYLSFGLLPLVIGVGASVLSLPIAILAFCFAQSWLTRAYVACAFILAVAFLATTWWHLRRGMP